MLNSKEIISHTKDLNILFVEDHEDLRVNISHILQKFYNIVDVASNGEVAFKMYKESPSKYDIIISDIQMPKLNGVELTKEIYNINSKQVIIILSAHNDSKYLQELINLKIEHFLNKPIDYQDLLKALLNASKRVNNEKNQTIANKIHSIVNISNNITFNKENNLLYNDTTMIVLTKYELIFMQLLTRDIGKIFSNEDITSHYNKLNENLDSTNIRKLVSKLRKKLPANTIESLYGVGYRLIPLI